MSVRTGGRPAAPIYFAYGSNLSLPQMTERCGSVELLGPAVLPAHRLVFAGASRNWGGSGVATVLPHDVDSVPGCLYRVGDAGLTVLDRFEGSYARRSVRVRVRGSGAATAEPEEAEAWTYVRRSATPRRPPSPVYAAIMAHAYGSHGHSLEPLLVALAEAASAIDRP